MKVIFVDGYNVINSWPTFKELKGLEFDTLRQKLIDVLENYAVFNNCRVFIVFDAHSSKRSGERRIKISKHLSVIFTSYCELADTYIERIVHKIGRKYEIVVVTSDFLEQQTIFQRGACRISSIEFYKDVYDIHNKITDEIRKNQHVRKNFLLIDKLDEDIIKKLEEIRKGD